MITKFKVASVNVQAKEVHVLAYGEGDPKDEACPFKYNSHNSIVSLWLKPEAAADFKEGDILEVKKVE